MRFPNVYDGLNGMWDCPEIKIERLSGRTGTVHRQACLYLMACLHSKYNIMIVQAGV